METRLFPKERFLGNKWVISFGVHGKLSKFFDEKLSRAMELKKI
jgi:hypothetical protein